MHLKHRSVIYCCCFWVCLLLFGHLWAQESHHYVYIQSEKGQTFYVKHNGKILSSTERGYLIIPQLDNGTVPITIGFPQNEFPEAQFYLRIGNNDQGYILKRSGGTGYSLYNLQTFREIKSEAVASSVIADKQETPDMQVSAPDTVSKKMMTTLQKDLETTFADKAVITGPDKPVPARTNNSFASALDKVVVTRSDRDMPAEGINNKVAIAVDTAVAEEIIVKRPRHKKHKSIKAPLTKEEEAILSEVLAAEERTAASEAAAATIAPATEPVHIQKKHKSKAQEPDFIEFQPEQPPHEATKETADHATGNTSMQVAKEAQQALPKKKKRKLFDDTEHPATIITDSSGYSIAAATPNEPAINKKKNKHKEITAEENGVREVSVDAGITAKHTATSARLINTDCPYILDEATFRKVLRKFATAKNDDGMIDVFRRQIHNKCLSTTQLKTLVQLLVTDDSRYRLLDMAYSKTYDTENYNLLESLLSDNYYKNRFKAMLHK